MPLSVFEAFKKELQSLDSSLANQGGRTVRNEELRERFRDLFRSWEHSVSPILLQHIRTPGRIAKISAEIENLAKLASKIKGVTEYRRRLRRTVQILDELAIYLPSTTGIMTQIQQSRPRRDDLFLPGIPDLPSSLVPSSIIGWKSKMEAFINDHPFDKNVFIMIRYRERNKLVLNAIRDVLGNHEREAIIASEHNITDDLYNPVAALLCCSNGITVFDQVEAKQTINPNVAYELGMMHLLGRKCLILKHRSLKALQSDILMKLYEEYRDDKEARVIVKKWVEAS